MHGLCDVLLPTRSYMCLADLYLAPFELLRGMAARVTQLTGQNMAAPSSVANVFYNTAAMGVLEPEQAAMLVSYLYR